MGQIDKTCVTDNCSVIPTESVNRARFSYSGETCAVTQETTSKDTQTLISLLKLGGSWRGDPVSGNLWPQQDLRGKTLIIF